MEPPRAIGLCMHVSPRWTAPRRWRRDMQEYQPNPGTVVVIHFFSERTDGVSLQIKENARVLSILGWKVIECSADAIGDDSFVLPELDYATPQVQALKIGEMGGLQDEAKIV